MYLSSPARKAPKALRVHQQVAYDALGVWAKEQAASGVRGESAFIGFATGGGKTFLMAAWVRDNFQSLGGVVWGTHRDNLVEQARDELAKVVAGVPVGREQAGHHSREQIVVASIPSLKGERLTAFHDDMVARAGGRPILVIFDEAHHLGAESWQEVHGAFKDHGYFVNLTATPFLGTVDNPLNLGRCLAFQSTQDAIDNGTLVPYHHQAISLPELQQVEWSNQTGELTPEGAQLLTRPEVVEKLVADTLPQMQGHISMVFAANVDMAHQLKQAYAKQGLRAAVVTDAGTTATERVQAIAGMKAGKLDVLVGYDVFTEGSDFPAIDVVVNFRPTKFAHKYLQMIGRGLRPLHGPDGPVSIDGHVLKESCLLIDLWPGSPTDPRISLLPLPDDLRHTREESIHLKLGAQTRPWTRVDTFLACFHRTEDVDAAYAQRGPLKKGLTLEELGKVLGRPVLLDTELQQQPDYWPCHLAQATGHGNIEALAVALQQRGYEYFPTHLSLPAVEKVQRQKSRERVQNAHEMAEDQLRDMDTAFSHLHTTTKRILTQGHTLPYREIPREGKCEVKTLQINKYTELVLNPSDRDMLYFRTNGQWYARRTSGDTHRPYGVAIDDMNLSPNMVARPRPSSRDIEETGYALTRRMEGQLPGSGPIWAAASILYTRRANEALSSSVGKAIEGIEKWRIC